MITVLLFKTITSKIYLNIKDRDAFVYKPLFLHFF